VAASNHSSAGARGIAVLALSAVAAAPSAAQSPDLGALFAAGPRWSWSAGPAAPWIPRSVAFAAGGEVALAGTLLGEPALALLSGAGGAAGTPLVQVPLSGAIGAVQVEGGPAIDDVFALAQFANPDAAHKSTRVMRFGVAPAAVGAAPLWTHDLELVSSGGALLGADCQGLALVAAAHDAARGRVRLDWIERASGALLARVEVAGQALGRLSVAAGGARVALAAGLDVWVLDAAGAPLYHELAPSATEALALSDDGSVLVVGGFGEARVLIEQAGSYHAAWTIAAPPSEIAVRAALSADGGTVALGWWDFQAGNAFRCEARDGASHAQIVEVAQNGGALQNYPEALAVSADGRRFAFGVWGAQTSAPDVWLFDRGDPAQPSAPQPILVADVGGSVEALALDATGTRLLVGFKHAHANQFATTGTVRLFDSGERDVQVRLAPLLGGALALAAQSPGAELAWFGLGSAIEPAGTPFALPGIGGALALDVTAPLAVLAAPADAAGRAAIELSLPMQPALQGLPIAVQALFAAAQSATFSASLARPAIL
jgi:hypothetical protein